MSGSVRAMAKIERAQEEKAMARKSPTQDLPLFLLLTFHWLKGIL